MAIAALSQPRPRLRRKSYRDFSLTGLIYTCMMLFMGMAAVNSQANLLFAVFGLMVGILLVSSFISARCCVGWMYGGCSPKTPWSAGHRPCNTSSATASGICRASP